VAPPNNGRRKALLAALAAGGAGLFVPGTYAQEALKPGVQYRLIPQQPVTPGPRIEVLYFFFYACPVTSCCRGSKPGRSANRRMSFFAASRWW